MVFGENVIEIVIRARDEFSSAIDEVKGSLAGIGIAAAGVFTGMAMLMRSSIQETVELEAAQNRLARILKTSRGASEEQINVLFQQAKALEKVGVASEKNILTTQSQLSTFDLQAESIAALTPAILDYVVAEKGASASTDEYRQLTNGLAQALNGQFASLTRTGFVLDEETKKMISSGTEAERVAAIVKVLNSTYKDFNVSALNTTEGSLVVLNREFDNMKKVIGDALIPIFSDLIKIITPIIQAIGSWIQEHPKLTAVIMITITAVAGLTAAIIAVTIAVSAFSLAALPIAAVIVGIALVMVALVGVILYVWKNFDKFKIGLAMIWNDIVGFFESGVNSAIKALNFLIKAFNAVAGKLGFKKLIGEIGNVSLGRIDVGSMVAEVTGKRESEKGDTIVNIENVNGLDPGEVARALEQMLARKISI